LNKKELDEVMFWFKDRKKARSKAIQNYTDKPIICFSCGNCANELKKLNMNVFHIGENGDLTPNKWYTMKEIHERWEDYFDATSGHLNMELINIIAEEYKKQLKQLPNKVYLPTGSGETLLCLKIAFPTTKFIAVYNINKETEYNPHAPLNNIIKLITDKIIFYDKIQ